MSASEKLRALDQPRGIFPEGRWVDFDGTFVSVDAAIALTAALPQIIAVVEAAEEAVAYSSEGGETPRVSNLSAPLSALDRALS